MASIFIQFGLLLTLISALSSRTLSATVIEDLKTLKPPPDFNSTLMTNCLNNPSLRYCNHSPMDLDEIFKFTVVASHLCNESKNPNCVDSFPKIDLKNRPLISPLYLLFGFFWKYCPITVISIDLSKNSLKGTFPNDILQCTQTQDLDLSHNQLSGEFPFESFTPLTNLEALNVSYNRFTETVEATETELFFKRFGSSSFVHSGLIPNRARFRVRLVFFAIGFPVFVIVMVGSLGFVCLHRPDYLPRMLQRKYVFTSSMLKAATNKFSRENLAGKAEAFEVYRGTLRDGTDVRVEIYKDIVSSESRRKFVEECKILVQLGHRNVVRVLGWCENHCFRAVVSEWTEGQDVATWLLGSMPSWKHRLRVMKGVAFGVCYLQEKWPEVGYDLRTSSLLLSDNLEPLITRFKIEDHGNITRKIHQLGVLMLEIIAKKSVQREFEDREAGFVKYIRMHYSEDPQRVMDENMKLTDKAFEQAKQVIGLALTCTDQTTNRQMSLRHIYGVLSKAYESLTVVDFSYQKRTV